MDKRRTLCSTKEARHEKEKVLEKTKLKAWREESEWREKLESWGDDRLVANTGDFWGR